MTDQGGYSNRGPGPETAPPPWPPAGVQPAWPPPPPSSPGGPDGAAIGPGSTAFGGAPPAPAGAQLSPYPPVVGAAYAPPSGPYGTAAGYPPAAPGYYPPAAPGWQPAAPLGRSQLGVILRRRAMKQISIGVLLLVVGIAITAVTYSIASSSSTGGTYIVSFGPIIAGVLSIISGLLTLARASKLR